MIKRGGETQSVIRERERASESSAQRTPAIRRTVVQQPLLAANNATVLSARSGLLFLETREIIGMVKDLTGAYMQKY